MTEKLNRVFARAETDRNRIIQLLRSAPEEKLSQRISGKWSISQILSHIIIAEKLSLLYMTKKSLGMRDIGNTGLWEDIKSLFLKISQRMPLKYKAPKVLTESQPVHLSYDEIVKQWNEVRADLKTFIEQFDEQTVKKKIYRHPFSGRLNIVQAISFLREHANHHLPQIKRLL